VRHEHAAFEHLHGHVLEGHRHGFAVDEILRGVARDEFECPVGRRDVGGHRVRPGDVLAVTDRDDRRAPEARADHVVGPGHVDVRLPEAFSADPREVRVGDHQAAAVGGVFAADAEAVGARQ